jgi:hypothetical protein
MLIYIILSLGDYICGRREVGGEMGRERSVKVASADKRKECRRERGGGERKSNDNGLIRTGMGKKIDVVM